MKKGFFGELALVSFNETGGWHSFEGPPLNLQAKLEIQPGF
jgi:hypothetical protein